MSTTEENTFKPPQYLLCAKEDAFSNCSMLYCGRKKPISESLMSFGWEHGDGWNTAVAKLSYKLEMLNLLFYPKYGVRVEAVQVKEKFGTLRFYYDVRIDSPFIATFISRPFRLLHDFIRNKVNFSFETVIDVESHKEEGWEEISKDEYESKSFPEHMRNDFGWKFKKDGGKYYRNLCVFIPPKTHLRPTRHGVLFRIDRTLARIANVTDFSHFTSPSRTQKVVREFIETVAGEYVNEAEGECYGLCEECGRQIGLPYSPRCRTSGWVTYICDECAERMKKDWYDDEGHLHAYADRGNVKGNGDENNE